MSKSLGNYIGVAEPPNEIYGKVMSIPDSLIIDYFESVTDVPDEELEEFRQGLKDEIVNPMTLKKRLAREIVTQLYSQKAASEAEEHFVKVFQKREVPEDITECRFSFSEVASLRAQNIAEVRKGGKMIFNEFDDELNERIGRMGEDSSHFWDDVCDVSRVMVYTGQAKSRSEAVRLIRQGAVSIGGKKITGNLAVVQSGSIIKVGKRRFAKVINNDTLT
jgi:tyrosyl-tRNA synthetase